MANIAVTVPVALLVFAVLGTSSQKLVFEASPAEIYQLLPLTLTCRLQADANTALNSITINKNGQPVARVNEFYPTGAQVGKSAVKVNGRISGPDRSLMITWKDSINQVGKFDCRASIIKPNTATSTQLSAVVDVKVAHNDMNLMQLIGHVQDLQATVGKQQQTISQQGKQITQQLAMIKTQGHTEQGKVWCNRLYHSQTHYKTVKFATLYAKPPTVHFSLFYNDADTADDNLRYELDAYSIDTHGFTISCHTWDDSGFYKLGIHWLSLGS